MGMGQNLLIMWYKGWPSTLRFTGGTGFWPTSRCFSLFFPSMSSPQGPSPKSLVGKNTSPHGSRLGPRGSRNLPVEGFFDNHTTVFDGKRKHMSDICPPDVPGFFVDKNPLNLTIGAILPAEIHRCPKVPGHFQPFQPRTATATSPTESSCPSPSTCSRRWPRPGLRERWRS